jgi:hypothetical protein
MTSFWARFILLLCVLLPAALQAASGVQGEILDGHYAREGNGESPAQAAGNDIYLKFFPDRWVGMLFVPYDKDTDIDAGSITRALANARQQTRGAAYLRGRFDELPAEATAQIERYGYLEDRIAFECGALAPCTVRLGDAYLELIRPGIVTEHIVRYHHVAAE